MPEKSKLLHGFLTSARHSLVWHIETQGEISHDEAEKLADEIINTVGPVKGAQE